MENSQMESERKREEERERMAGTQSEKKEIYI